jgi:hypothetical protein
VKQALRGSNTKTVYSCTYTQYSNLDVARAHQYNIQTKVHGAQFCKGFDEILVCTVAIFDLYKPKYRFTCAEVDTVPVVRQSSTTACISSTGRCTRYPSNMQVYVHTCTCDEVHSAMITC